MIPRYAICPESFAILTIKQNDWFRENVAEAALTGLKGLYPGFAQDSDITPYLLVQVLIFHIASIAK